MGVAGLPLGEVGVATPAPAEVFNDNKPTTSDSQAQDIGHRMKSLLDNKSNEGFFLNDRVVGVPDPVLTTGGTRRQLLSPDSAHPRQGAQRPPGMSERIHSLHNSPES
jgi:hypothetical protein